MNKAWLGWVLVLLASSSCHKNAPIRPPDWEYCEYAHGNRTFSWRSDTVAWFPSTLGGIWAFSDSDAYLMGYIVEGKPPYRVFGGLHWDGISWNADLHAAASDIGHFSNDVIGDENVLISVGYYAVGREMSALAEFDNRTKKWTSHQFQINGELRSAWTDGNGYFIAVGDGGMVYTKDDQSSSWTYTKAPTDLGFTSVTGISRGEIYALAGASTVTGETHKQCWKYNGIEWSILYDSQNPTMSIIKLAGTEGALFDLAASRCPVTDTLSFYLIGWESYLLQSKGQDLDFHEVNLSKFGLPLRAMQRTAYVVNMFSPNDLWIFGTRYAFYHWNGVDFSRIVIPGLPADDTQFGYQRRMVRTHSGMVFFPSEVSPQVYVVARGTP